MARGNYAHESGYVFVKTLIISNVFRITLKHIGQQFLLSIILGSGFCYWTTWKQYDNVTYYINLVLRKVQYIYGIKINPS